MLTISPRWREEAVPVVFASDLHYIPYLAVAIRSLIEHATPEHRYDIIVFGDKESRQEEEKLRSMAEGKEYISIRCIDMEPFRDTVQQLESRNHLTLAAYYRLYIATICSEYAKAIYMDCDILCHADVAELYMTDLGDNLVAAAYDRPVQDMDSEWLNGARAYIESIGMKDARQCFNSGVLLLNLEQMRKENTQKHLLEVAALNKKYWNDQGVLNICCQGRVHFLPEAWNFTTHMYELHTLSPETARECRELLCSQNYKIIHYASGGIKPWQNFTSPAYRLWWEIAKNTPYYDEIRRRISAGIRKEMGLKALVKLMRSLLSAVISPTTAHQTAMVRQLQAYAATADRRLRWAKLWSTL